MKRAEGKFILFDLAEFASWLSALSVNRVIRVIQEHHTYLPDYSQFDRNRNHFDHLRSMEYSHLQRGFAEIAQNLTIFPDGAIAVCRSFEKIPAGIKGANKYAICIENLGNFDAGGDAMRAEQTESIIQTTALLCRKFHLEPGTDSILYHHWFDLTSGERTNGSGNTKTCPGTAFFKGNSVQQANDNFIPLVEHAFAAATTLVPLGQVPALYVAEVTTDTLNIRNLPGLSGLIIGNVGRGVDVQVYRQTDGWCQIHPTESQWVSGRYLGVAVSPTAAAPPVYTAEVLVSALNVRTLPSMSGRVIRELSRGISISVWEEQGEWCRIHPTESQWVNGSFVGRATVSATAVA